MVVTDFLERLIWAGKATFKVFNAGGSERVVLEVPEDRQLVVTGVTLFPPVDGDPSTPAEFISQRLFQAKIFNSDAAYEFIYRSNNSVSQGAANYSSPGEPIHFDTYMVFKDDIIINFLRGGDLQSGLQGFASHDAYSLKPPNDFGSDSAPNKIATDVASEYQGATFNLVNIPGGDFYHDSSNKDPFSFGVSFPVDSTTRLRNPLTAQGMPLMTLRYVEIKMHGDAVVQSQ